MSGSFQHFTFRSADGAVDSSAWLALGQVTYGTASAEESSVKCRRSLCVVKNIKADDVLTSENVRAIRVHRGSSASAR